MSKYKEEDVDLKKDMSKGWTKSVNGIKYYHKSNWIISYYKNLSFSYWIIDESYPFGCYFTWHKRNFLEERYKLAYKNALVWKALHGEYKKET